MRGTSPILVRGYQTWEISRPPTFKKCGLALNPSSQTQLPSHCQVSKMNGRDEQTDCRQRRTKSWLPAPEMMHKEQGVPQIAQRDFAEKIAAPN